MAAASPFGPEPTTTASGSLRRVWTMAVPPRLRPRPSTAPRRSSPPDVRDRPGIGSRRVPLRIRTEPHLVTGAGLGKPQPDEQPGREPADPRADQAVPHRPERQVDGPLAA